MLKRFKIADDASSENRKKFLKAQKFALGGEYQWDDKMYDLRKTDNRPRDSYNRCPQFIKQVTNDARMNQTEIRFVPNEDSDKETAEIREDLAREIQSGPEAAIAYETALENAVEGGWGYFRFLTDYANNESFDQIIKLDWVPNPLVIYDDPNTQRFDCLDRNWLIHVADVPMTDLNGQYDLDYDDTTLISIGSSAPEWCEIGKELVRIAEYWEVVESKSYIYRNKQSGEITKEKPEDINNYDMREISSKKVIWRKCTACDVLETRDWAGEYIPYCKVVADERIVDGKKITTGLIERMMASQVQYNLWTNAVTEQVSLAPKTPWIIPVRAIKNYEKYWDTSNTRNWAYLPYHDTDENGNAVNPPQRAQAGVDISASVALIQQADQNFYATTGIYPASLGAKSNETSGKAILARQREGDVSTFHYIDNLDRAKLAGGIIMNDLISKIYDGARTITTRKEDRTLEKVKINQSYQEENGETKEYDMTKGNYSVMTVIGPTFTTKRQETAESQIAMMQTPLGQIIAQAAPDLVIASQDWAGADKLAERVKRALPPEITQDENEAAPEIPPQVKQSIEQMGQTIEQLQAALQAADEQIQSKQADLQLKQADIEAKKADMQLKANQQALDAQDAERKHEIDVMELQLKANDNQLKQEALELDKKRLELEFIKAQLENETGENHLEEVNYINPNDENGLKNQLSSLQEAKLAREAERQMKAEKEARDEEDERMRSDLLMQNLGQINNQLMALTQSITAPKRVIRDHKTGSIQGVVTDGVM